LIQSGFLLFWKGPKDFDHDIFAQMQHFLVMCSEEFKGARDYAHMSRIIYVFYLFGESSWRQREKNPNSGLSTSKSAKPAFIFLWDLKKFSGFRRAELSGRQ